MADIVDKRTRSRMMAAVRSKNTKPELHVRSALHRAGLRFRLHDRRLPGTPDLVLRRHRTVVFCMGCFWHGHSRCHKATLPTTNTAFWAAKIGENRARDRRAQRALARAGWHVVRVWECEIKKGTYLASLLQNFGRDLHAGMIYFIQCGENGPK